MPRLSLFFMHSNYEYLPRGGRMLPYLHPITPATTYFLSLSGYPIIPLFAHFMAFIGGTAVRGLYCVLIGIPFGTERRDCCFMFRDYARENPRFMTTRAIARIRRRRRPPG